MLQLYFAHIGSVREIQPAKWAIKNSFLKTLYSYPPNA